MKIVELSKFRLSKRYKTVMKRCSNNYDSLFPVVGKIMKEIELYGDLAIKKYTNKFDGVNISDTKVGLNEIRDAYKKVDKKYITALKQAIKNITAVHNNQIPPSAEKIIQTTPGVRVWKKWQPIERVGLYVPGGRALYPSSVLMNGIPAKIAGCKQITITTPPRKDGTIAPEILVTADMIGIKDIYKIGGIQGIGALTYGTRTIPKVDKIVGPGNSYVTVAKMIGLMSGKIAIDSPAGPSEVFTIADETANSKFIASDLMCDTEHGEDSTAILVSTSKKILEQTIYEIKTNSKKFSTKKNIQKSINKYGLFALVKSIEEGVNFANDYAPEHIQIMTKNSMN